MKERARVVLSWSSGKDCAWALHVLRQQGDVEVVGLLTTVNARFERVAMHGVRAELLRAQADALGLPLVEVPIPYPSVNADYELAMAAALSRLAGEGVTAVAFGDLFLEDVRRYREERMRGTGIAAWFPLWGRCTASLAREVLGAGLRARVTCVDPRQLDAAFAGREFDERMLDELPPDVDPCGEHGEFHTFVHAGPMFRRPVPVASGERVERDGFVFAELRLEVDAARGLEEARCGAGVSSR